MLLFQVIHLAIAAIQRFMAHWLQLIPRFTQTWKHICLASCPRVFVIRWELQWLCQAQGPRTLSPSPYTLPSTSSSLRHCQLARRPNSRLKADRLCPPLSCFLLFLNPFENLSKYIYKPVMSLWLYASLKRTSRRFPWNKTCDAGRRLILGEWLIQLVISGNNWFYYWHGALHVTEYEEVLNS